MIEHPHAWALRAIADLEPVENFVVQHCIWGERWETLESVYSGWVYAPGNWQVRRTSYAIHSTTRKSTRMNYREAMLAYGQGKTVQFKNFLGNWETVDFENPPDEWRVLEPKRYQVLFKQNGKFLLSTNRYASAHEFINNS